jgi:glycosyltransferase involved in cell wall biosynthesis
MSEPTISLCMIVKNEEASIERCLKSVCGLVDEILITDTGSQDRTIEIARNYHAVVEQHPWQNDFAASRNLSKDKAHCDWIFFLDADEELTKATTDQLKPILQSTRADGISMLQRSLQPGNSLIKYQDTRITRLFRNKPMFRFEGAIHEQIRPSILRNGGNILDSELVFLHYGYLSNTAQGASRTKRNLEILIQSMKENREDAYLFYQIGATYIASGNPSAGVLWLKRSLDITPCTLGNDVLDLIYMKLAQQLLGFDDYASAITYAGKSLEVNPNNMISLYVLGLCFIYSGKINQAYPIYIKIRDSEQLNLENLSDIDKIIAYSQNIS